MEKKAVSYEYVSFIVDLLAQRVGREYDYIIGIGRGGLIPATMLAYKLKKKVLAFGISTYNDMHSDHCFVYQKPTLEIGSSHKYLIVDDICDTGNTFDVFRKTFDPTKYNYEFASLFVRDSKAHSVDHYGLSVAEKIWIDFPWSD